MKVGAIGKSKPVSGNSEPPPPAEQEHAEAEEHDQEPILGSWSLKKPSRTRSSTRPSNPSIKPGAQLPKQNASNSRSSIGQRWPGQHGASLKKEISSSGLMRRAKSHCWSHRATSRVGTPAENFKRMISRTWRIATLSAGFDRFPPKGGTPNRPAEALVAVPDPRAGSFRYGGRHHLVMTGGLGRNQQY